MLLSALWIPGFLLFIQLISVSCGFKVGQTQLKRCSFSVMDADYIMEAREMLAWTGGGIGNRLAACSFCDAEGDQDIRGYMYRYMVTE